MRGLMGPLGLAVLLTAAPARAQVPADSAAGVIVALERAAMDRSDAGDGGEAFLQLSADDVVYMDPALEKPIHGLDGLKAYYRGLPRNASALAPGRMANVQVQVSGEMAVLTYNYLAKRSWNVTEVYRRTEHGWRIIHSHFSYLRP